MNKYTIGILGDNCVGKTTYLKRITTGYFDRQYTHTLNCNIYSHKEITNKGEFIFILKDIPINDIELNINDCDGFIIFYSCKIDIINEPFLLGLKPNKNIQSIDFNIEKYINLIKNKPYIVFENKYDLTNDDYESWKDDKMSNKTNTNYHLPLITLLRKIKFDENLDYYNEND